MQPTGNPPLMGKPPFQLWTVLALLLLGSLVLTWPWLSGAVTVPWDAKAHFQPQLAFLAKSLASGQSPFWTPNVFTGHPQVADPQSLIFSPPYLLMALLNPAPDLMALDGVLFASLFVGSVFIVLYFKDRGWHEAGALVAAFSFSLGGMAAWRIQHVGQVLSLAYLPIALWLLDRALTRASMAYGLAAGVIAGFMLLGRDQVAFLGVVALAAYALHGWIGQRLPLRLALRPLIAGAMGGGVVVAVPMVLTLLLAADSNRPVITLVEAGKGSLHPWSLLTGVIPHLYGIARPLSDYWGPPSPDWGPVDLYLARNMATLYFGILPVMGLALLPVLLRKRWGDDPNRRDALFLAAACLVFLLYSLGRYTPFFSLVFMAVPGVDRFRRPADALFLACAFGSMAGGYAVHRWIALPRLRLTWPVLVLLGALALAALISGVSLAQSVGRMEQTIAPLAAALCFLVAGGMCFLLLRQLEGRTSLLMLSVSLFMLADLGWNNAPNESTGLATDTYDVLRPQTQNETIRLLKERTAATRGPDRIDRVELAGLGFHWPNASLVHDLHHTLGYNPVRDAHYSRAIGTRDHIAMPTDRLFTPLFPSYRSLMADLTGLRFIASPVPLPELDPKAHEADFPVVARTPDGIIYENPRALPRVLFAGRAIAVETEGLIDKGQWPDGFDPRESVVLGRAVTDAEAAAKPGAREVRILSYRNTEVIIEAQSQSGGFVVLNDLYDDWWRVSVNGAPATMERANAVFRAVAVPPGVVRVRFSFHPFRGAWRELREKK
jgi:hypothetical protein